MVDVKRLTKGTWIGELSGGKESVFKTVFFWSVQVCLDPWTVLRQPDLQRYLFFQWERYVFVFLGEKFVPVDIT
jgi:hypothetical protein